METFTPRRASRQEQVKSAWDALPEPERQSRMVKAREYWTDPDMAFLQATKDLVPELPPPQPTYSVSRVIIQCLPEVSCRSIPDERRGLVFRIMHKPRSSHVYVVPQQVTVEPPADFDVEFYFRKRYGIRLVREPEVEAAILPFRRKAQ